MPLIGAYIDRILPKDLLTVSIYLAKVVIWALSCMKMRLTFFV